MVLKKPWLVLLISMLVKLAMQTIVVLRQKNNTQLEKLLDLTMVHIFDQFAKDRSLQKSIKDLPVLIAHMRGLYTAPRSKGDILVLRKGFEDIINKYLKLRNPPQVAAIRTGILLYIVIRAFSKDYYA